MNWYHRGEERYVEYGSSFPATRAFGVVRSLYDTVYNMNLAHLSRDERTVFEVVEEPPAAAVPPPLPPYKRPVADDDSDDGGTRRLQCPGEF